MSNYAVDAVSEIGRGDFGKPLGMLIQKINTFAQVRRVRTHDGGIILHSDVVWRIVGNEEKPLSDVVASLAKKHPLVLQEQFNAFDNTED